MRSIDADPLISNNPAGLSVVSVGQGCYIGQETLSKLTNLDAVKQQLWGFELSTPANVGDEISGRLPFAYNDRVSHCSEKE